jgi:hypothetical protein
MAPDGVSRSFDEQATERVSGRTSGVEDLTPQRHLSTPQIYSHAPAMRRFRVTWLGELKLPPHSVHRVERRIALTLDQRLKHRFHHRLTQGTGIPGAGPVAIGSFPRQARRVRHGRRPDALRCPSPTGGAGFAPLAAVAVPVVRAVKATLCRHRRAVSVPRGQVPPWAKSPMDPRCKRGYCTVAVPVTHRRRGRR